MAGIYVADATKLSLAATMPEFLEAERTHGSLRRAARSTANGQPTSAGARYESFLTLRRGMSTLVEALVRTLPGDCVELKTPVVELSRSADRRWSVAAAGRPPVDFDGVILATPAPRAARLFERIDPQLFHLLDRIEYASSVVVTHVYPRDALPEPLDAFGFVVPRIERRSLLAASFPGVKFPHHAPAELVPIRAFLGGALHPEVISQDDDELASLAHRELRDLLNLRGDPVETHVARWTESMPQYRVGHVQHADAIEHMVGSHRGLELAGNAYRGVGIPQCIRSGQEAAARLAKSLVGVN
jgi:oxygen-dependent protoporphyrinogen oxidase